MCCQLTSACIQPINQYLMAERPHDVMGVEVAVAQTIGVRHRRKFGQQSALARFAQHAGLSDVYSEPGFEAGKLRCLLAVHMQLQPAHLAQPREQGFHLVRHSLNKAILRRGT